MSEQASVMVFIKALENLEKISKVNSHIDLHTDKINILHSLNPTNIYDPLTEEM